MQSELLYCGKRKTDPPQKLSRRILRTNSAEQYSYPLDEPRLAKVQSEIASSGAAAYKYHTWNSIYMCHVWREQNPFWPIMHKPSTEDYRTGVTDSLKYSYKNATDCWATLWMQFLPSCQRALATPLFLIRTKMRLVQLVRAWCQ